jgi:ribosomal protein L37AE/L43A
VESFREIIPEEKQALSCRYQSVVDDFEVAGKRSLRPSTISLEELKILEKVLMPALTGWRAEHKVMEAKSQEMRNEISNLLKKIEQLEGEEKEILNGMTVRKKEMEVVEKAVGELFTDIGAEITSFKKKVDEFTAESAVSQPVPPRESLKSDIPSEEKRGGELKSEIPEATVPKDTEYQKKCPMCGGQMNLHIKENKWVCYSCAHEELKKEQEGSEQKNEISELSAPVNTEWQKKCPMCGGQMNFQIKDEMWICYSCAYEESKKDEVQDRSKGKSEQTNALASESTFDPSPLDVPSASLFPDDYRKPKKASSSSNNQPSGKKKACPVCHKKMDWYESEKAWRCPFCDYERSI